MRAGNATGINFFAVADDAQGETVRWTASIWHARKIGEVTPPKRPGILGPFQLGKLIGDLATPSPSPPVMYGGPPDFIRGGSTSSACPPLEPPTTNPPRVAKGETTRGGGRRRRGTTISPYFTGSRGVFSRASAGHKRKSLVKIGEVTPPKFIPESRAASSRNQQFSATGTNHRGLNPFMDGDKIELTCEGCGTLHIMVRDELKGHNYQPLFISRAAGGYFPAHLRGTSENRW